MPVEFELRNAGGMTGTTGVTAALNLQRSQIITPEVLQWVKEGRVFNALSGVLTSPATFSATTLTRQQPQLLVRVPAGRVIIPVCAQICYEATGGTLLEALVSTSDNDPGVTNGTAVTPTNVNTRYAASTGSCSVYKDFTGSSGTAPTNVADVWRAAHSVDFDSVAHGNQEQIVYSPFSGRGTPVIVGSASNMHAFYVYAACGTSSTGFVVLTYAEFSYTEFYGAG